MITDISINRLINKYKERSCANYNLTACISMYMETRVDGYAHAHAHAVGWGTAPPLHANITHRHRARVMRCSPTTTYGALRIRVNGRSYGQQRTPVRIARAYHHHGHLPHYMWRRLIRDDTKLVVLIVVPGFNQCLGRQRVAFDG